MTVKLTVLQMSDRVALEDGFIYIVTPWYPQGIGSRTLLQILKPVDVQVPYIKWCSICIFPKHSLLCTLNLL
jgi:hypothetical protein